MKWKRKRKKKTSCFLGITGSMASNSFNRSSFISTISTDGSEEGGGIEGRLEEGGTGGCWEAGKGKKMKEGKEKD